MTGNQPPTKHPSAALRPPAPAERGSTVVPVTDPERAADLSGDSGPGRLDDSGRSADKGRARRKWPLVLVGALVVVAGGTAAWASSAHRATTAKSATNSGQVAAAPAREGVFSFVAGKSRCGVQSVGPAGLTQRPKGEFCLVDVDVTNHGSDADLLDGGPQRAVDQQGREYPIADAAEVFLNTTDPTILNEIEPGVTVHATLPFDVPAGTRIAALILHDSMTSTGVRVPLN